MQRDAGLLAAAGATQEHGQVLSRARTCLPVRLTGPSTAPGSHATRHTFGTPALNMAGLTSWSTPAACL